jgi:CBS domain-containing protein
MSEEKVRTEEFQVSGDMLVSKIKELVHEGNIRRILIKNEEGKTLIDIPLTLGVVGAFLAPQLAAIGAVAALVTQSTIVVEKVEE